jgi:hypothetical protein
LFERESDLWRLQAARRGATPSRNVPATVPVSARTSQARAAAVPLPETPVVGFFSSVLELNCTHFRHPQGQYAYTPKSSSSQSIHATPSTPASMLYAFKLPIVNEAKTPRSIPLPETPAVGTFRCFEPRDD